MTFAIATLKSGEILSSAVVIANRFWPVQASAEAARVEIIPGTLFDYLQQWDSAFPQLERLAEKITSGAVPPALSLSEAEVQLTTPVSLPRKVFAIGANYQSHIDEMAAMMMPAASKTGPAPPKPVLDMSKPPFFFIKPGSTAVVGPGPTVHIPAKCSNFDWEVEVAVVFGKRGRKVKPEDVLDYVAGYTLAIDFTARNQLAIPEHVFRWDFILGKCQDSTTPVGPVFVPKQFVDGANIDFTLSVNGELKQSASTKDMLYTLAQQIVGISEGVSIEPGDLMLTGSPEGVGHAQGQRLAPGDVVVVSSSLIGSMEVTIQEPFV